MAVMLTSGIATQVMHAQEYVAPPVTISKEKVKIDGKAFYSHIVLERQTLFSISKAYNVTVEDIYRYNPEVKERGLRKNDIIMIPVVEIPETKEEAATVEISAPKSTVDRKDATISMEANAEVAQGQRRHIVKWYEDLSTIAAKYGVSEASIMTANNLKDNKLKKKQVLIIPGKEQYVAPAEDVVSYEESISDDATEIPESSDIEIGDQPSDTIALMEMWNPFSRRNTTTTLLLPLKATGSSGSKSNMDFYSGALLAAHDLKEAGIDVRLNVYDIAGGNTDIPGGVLSSSDVIIGPVSATDISKVFSLTSDLSALVSPLDQKVEKIIPSYSRLIQAPASQQAQFTDVVLWISEDLQPEDKVIVISEKEARQSDAGRLLRATIDSYGISYTPFSYSILEGRNILPALESKMTQTGTNRIVIASESEAFVNDAVRNLNLAIHDKYNLVLYAPAKIRSFETIEVENFHNTSLHASLTYYIDYEDERVQDFISKYRAMFNTEPTQFAFQGYDMMRFFNTLAARFGNLWPQMLENADAGLLQSNMRLRRTGSGSHTNTGTRRIVYGKDYSIKTVR